jgi:hypothetical protein
MFHVELRQFPHNHVRFNLSDGELVALVDPWVREQWVDMGERRWNRNLATMTIVEGPRLPVQKLAMGRGWRTAQREGEDVTERVMAAAKGAMERAGQGSGGNGAGAVPEGSTRAGAPGREPALGAQADLGRLSSLLGSDAPRLLEAWLAVAEASPELEPSESLALAERQLSAADTSAR